MVTIGQIAKIAKVSRYTASKVLNGDRSVRAETREKVLEICRELGYVPNLNAVNLVRGRTNLVGLIVPYITDGFYSGMIEKLEQGAQERGFMLIYKSSYNNADMEAQIIREFLSLQICALLVVPTVENPDRAAHAQAAANIPVIYLDRPFSQESYCVLNDNYNSAHVMTVHLLKRTGQVAFLASFYGDKNPTSRARRLGYEQAMIAHGQTPCVIPILDSEARQDNELCAYQTMRVFLQGHHSCRALFCVTDAAAFGALLAIREAGFSPGKDFFVGGHDNLRFGEFATPSITTMAQPVEMICSAALELLVSNLNGEFPTKRHWSFPSQLLVRQSG